MKVFINPGHHFELDPGAVNPVTGDREVDVAIKCAKLVEKYLLAAGVQCTVGQYNELYEICDASNAYDADLFISIHCNACASHQARGTETYYKSFHGQRLANYIQSQIIRSLPVTDRGVKEGNLYVLKHTEAVAVLVELAFIDNPEDLALLKNRIDDFARAIARGVTEYEIA